MIRGWGKEGRKMMREEGKGDEKEWERDEERGRIVRGGGKGHNRERKGC